MTADASPAARPCALHEPPLAQGCGDCLRHTVWRAERLTSPLPSEPPRTFVTETHEVVELRVERNAAGVRVLRAARETKAQARIVAALAAARDVAKAVLKGSTAEVRSDKGNYSFKYAGSDHVVAVARDALHESGIAVTRVEYLHREHTGTARGVLDSLFRVAHTSGEFFEVTFEDWPVLMGAGRTMDVALRIALTGSVGYFLRDLLLLPRLPEDDPEHGGLDEREDGRAPRRGQPRTDTTGAESVRERRSARGNEVLRRLDSVRNLDDLAERQAWWRKEKGDNAAGAAARFTAPDVRAIDERFGELTQRLTGGPQAPPLDDGAPWNGPDDAADDVTEEEPPPPAREAPPPAAARPAPPVPARSESPPPARAARRGGRGSALPGMQ